MTHIWFLEDPWRLARERAAIRDLEQSTAWLVGTHWSLADGLCVDAVIRAHAHDYEVRLTYPPLFPAVPPTVRPRQADRRWSDHQYGDRGALCLEWGPDNWRPEVTGAQVLESAHKLLYIENPLGNGTGEATAVAPSRHELTIGQELRGRFGRFSIDRELVLQLAGLPDSTMGTLRFSTLRRPESWMAFVYDVARSDTGERFSDPAIPQFLRESGGGVLLWTGVFIRTDLDPGQLAGIASIADAENILAAGYPPIRPARAEDNATTQGEPPSGLLILDGAGTPHMFFVFDDGQAFKLAPVHSGSAAASRAPWRHELAMVAVGIVGLGSAGSKVAASLARMGVKRFFLLDHDVFLPENVARNALDWGSVGDHKVDAVRALLGRIGADITVDVSRLHLTGQESTAAVSGALEELVRCDLIIDATADPAVFNLLAAAATRYAKPLVWMEVFAGGVGGLLARSRPGRDPDPQTMRAVYLGFCEEHPAPELRPGGDYAITHGDGVALVASDADVAIIAHHAARLAVDTVRGAESSYPHSLYLIGLATWWVFSAPFHTIPIATDQHRRDTPTDAPDEEVFAEGMAFVEALLTEQANAPVSPT